MRGTTAWVVLICLVGLVILVNMLLLAAWVRRNQSAPQRRSEPTFGRPSFTRSWEDEYEQFRKLAESVRALKDEKPASSPNDDLKK